MPGQTMASFWCAAGITAVLAFGVLESPAFAATADTKVHEFDVAVEGYGYKYKETVSGDSFVGLSGPYYGGAIAYTFRPAEPIREVEYLDMYRLDVRYGRGKVDYAGSGTYSDIDDSTLEVRGLVGRDLSGTWLSPTFYSGIGYRYLANELSQIPAAPGYYSGYDRESTYWYLPIGVECHRPLGTGWGLRLTAEYDFLIKGTQASHFEDMRTYSGESGGFSTTNDDQDSGYGLRASFRVVRESSGPGFFLEPFVRYWNIASSDSSCTTSTTGHGTICGAEPDNTTRELGVKAGVTF